MSAQSNQSVSLWRPLKNSVFRNLIMADVVSDIGTFMQSVGAAWLMVSLNAGPMLVALTQTASALPFFLLALPAGAIQHSDFHRFPDPQKCGTDRAHCRRLDAGPHSVAAPWT